MSRLLTLIVIVLCTGFIRQKDKVPYLTKLTVIPDKDPCNAPNAVFEQKYSDSNFVLSFGYDDYFEKQDTVQFSYKNDSLFINVIKRNKPRIVVKDGKSDTLAGLRADPDCECYTLFRLEFRDLPQKPTCITVNKYIHDDKLGFVTSNYLEKLRSKIKALEDSRKFSLDSTFALPVLLNLYPGMEELAWYLKRRGSLSIIIVDADTRSEKELVTKMRKLFIKKEMICPTRISDALDRNFTDKDSTTITIKISETKSFLFPDYNWRAH